MHGNSDVFIIIRTSCLAIILIIVATAHNFTIASTSSAPTKPIKSIIFDCDGVLVDTEHLKFEAWISACAKRNIIFTLDDYVPMVGYSSEKIASKIEALKKVHFDKKALIQDKDTLYKHRQARGVPPIPEAVLFLKNILAHKAQYGIKVGLASSASRAEIIRNLESIGVNPTDFDAIVSGEDDLKHIVDPEDTNKPKPYIYQTIAQRLDVRPEDCIVFEDTYAGVEAAATAGMRVFGTPNRFTEKHDFSKATGIISFKNADPKKLLDTIRK